MVLQRAPQQGVVKQAFELRIEQFANDGQMGAQHHSEAREQPLTIGRDGLGAAGAEQRVIAEQRTQACVVRAQQLQGVFGCRRQRRLFGHAGSQNTRVGGALRTASTMPDRREACIDARMTSPDPNALRSWWSGATHAWPLRGLFVIALIALLREAQTLLAPVLIAVVLTFVLAPPVRWLRRRGVPEALGALLVVAALLGSTLPLAASLVQPAAEWWERAPLTLEQLLAKLDKLRANLPLLAPPSQAESAPASTRARVAGQHPRRPRHRRFDPVKERIASESIQLGGRLLRPKPERPRSPGRAHHHPVVLPAPRQNMECCPPTLKGIPGPGHRRLSVGERVVASHPEEQTLSGASKGL